MCCLFFKLKGHFGTFPSLEKPNWVDSFGIVLVISRHELEYRTFFWKRTNIMYFYRFTPFRGAYKYILTKRRKDTYVVSCWSTLAQKSWPRKPFVYLEFLTSKPLWTIPSDRNGWGVEDRPNRLERNKIFSINHFQITI